MDSCSGVGFRIVTNGDQIAVDLVQNENGTFDTSAIPTTTVSVTRAQDAVTVIGSLSTVVSGAAVSAVFNIKVNPDFDFPANNNALMGDTAAGRLELTDGGGIKSIVSGNTLALTLPAFSNALFFSGVKTGHSWSASGRTIACAVADPTLGGVSATDAVVPTFGANTRLGFSSVGFITGTYFRRLTFWNSRISDIRLLGLTFP